MKIAKDLLKIAHELDESGLYDLADSIELIAVSLSDGGFEKFARAGNWQAMLSRIERDSTNPNEAAAALNRLKRFVELGKAPAEALEQAEKAMAARKVSAPSASTGSAPKPPPAAEADYGIKRNPGESAADATKRWNAEQVAKSKADSENWSRGRAKGPAPDPRKNVKFQSPEETARLREIAQKGKPSGQMAVRSLTVNDVAAKVKPSAARSLTDRARGALKGFKPTNFLGGVVGTGAGAYVGSELGRAIGGGDSAETGATLGGLAGGALARTPQGVAAMLALAAGWAIGTAINEAGLGDAIQQALSAKEDASAEAGQLKDMIEIFDKTAKIIDHPATPMETKVKKYLNVENLINNIIKHPAALPVLGQDGVEKFRGFKAKMDADVAAAAASAPAADVAPAGSAPAVKAPRKVSPSPAIIQLQKNLNKLHDAGSISLSAKLVEDGFVGKYTRGAISAFDPASGGRVTRDLLKRVSEAAANAGNNESAAPAEQPVPISVAAPFVSSEPMMSPSPSRISVVAPFNSGGVAR